ncbi:hypothetical protein PS903_02130 [Pseudomonas fluorescens]|nr:hypothetical protein PS903_02130 [Pseudomonas fluorescens]
MADIELYDGGGELAPYSPSQPLAPAPSPDTSGGNTLTPREIDDHQSRSGAQLQIFGATLPPGADPQRLAQTLNEIQALIASDLMRLGHPQASINAAISWFQNNARKTPQRETKRHSYNLHDQAGDLVAESFGNAMARAGASQEFISNCLWLLGELNKRLNTKTGSEPAPRTAPNSPNPLDSLNDQQYAQVVAANDAARATTMDYLRSIWHDSFEANLRMVDRYYVSLPLIEQKALDQMTTGYISSLNTREVILHLFKQALQEKGGALPSGGALAAEIAEHERAMKVDRRAWLKDEIRQSRYRELITLRDRS